MADSNIVELLSVAYIAIVTGILLIITAICGAFSRGTFKILYILLLFIMIVALVFISYVSLALVYGTPPFRLEEKLEEAWISTVEDDRKRACDIEVTHRCYGFYDNFCVGCWALNDSNIPVCSPEKQPSCPYCPKIPVTTIQGCYTALLRVTTPVYKPLGFTCCVIALFLVTDAIVVSFYY